VPSARPEAAPAELLGRCRFPAAGSAVTCAVSGGADSLALLVLACHAGLDVTAVHVDHGLRPGSAAEADVVAAVADRFGAAFRSVRVDVGDGPNLEARARQARYGVLPADALTGHTADDQAETVLINLLRGGGADGLAGMRADNRRPLLALRRHETAALCEELDVDPVQDPSNTDSRFLRNRVRHELLPLLADMAGRDPVPVLVRQAALLRDEADLLDALAAEVDATDARALAVRRLLRDEHPPSAADVDRVLAVARQEVRACEVAGGRRVSRSANRIAVSPDNRAE
jgi:tRNA(Ile)-lysidine synthase